MTQARKRLTRRQLWMLVQACVRGEVAAQHSADLQPLARLCDMGLLRHFATGFRCRPTLAGRAHIRKACEVES